MVLRDGVDPRLLVAFPAGDSGSAIWFEHSPNAVTWTVVGAPRPVLLKDRQGRILRGITAELRANAAELRIRQAVLSSIRVLRNYQDRKAVPAAILITPVLMGRTLSWQRNRLDGAAGYKLSLEVLEGQLQLNRIIAARDRGLKLRITAATGDAPLHPLTGTALLNRRALADPMARDALDFLSYREKFLAGSWHYDTYFGRDTLMSLHLLQPVLAPTAIEDGLASVLTRLSPRGEVAHEEDIGEFAVLEHILAHQPPTDSPVFNYDMIDGNYMLAPVCASWLLDDPRGKARASGFLSRTDIVSHRPFGANLVLNLRLVLQSATAFVTEPRFSNLISIRPGQAAGDWRDSAEGLGRGRYPYDVNAVFVPAALEAAGRLYASGLLGPYINDTDRSSLAKATSMAAIWRARAGPLFEVEIPNGIARRRVTAYGTANDLPIEAPARALGEQPIRFQALALTQDGIPVPVLNSDVGFDLLFGSPSYQVLHQEVAAIMRPFPAGLLTDVGVVVANPVFASSEVQPRFSKNAYHGEVIWSWQHAVLAAGLERQLLRTDLPPPERTRIRVAQRRLWRAIEDSRAARNAELWSWTYRAGRFQIATFGAGETNDDESDAVQLWSTVFLAIRDPLKSK